MPVVSVMTAPAEAAQLGGCVPAGEVNDHTVIGSVEAADAARLVRGAKAPRDVLSALVRVHRAGLPGGLDGFTGEEALLVVEAAEAVKAFADSVSVAATAVLVGELEADHPDSYAGDERRASRRRLLQQECRRVAAREVQTGTGLPLSAAQDRVWLAACEPERTTTVRQLMGNGRVSYHRALTLTQRTQHLDAVVADRIAARVLAPITCPTGEVLAGQAPLSQSTFYARLGRQLLLHEGARAEAERTHAEAVKARDVRTEPQRSGTGLLVISADGPRVAAAAGRVETIARRLRKGGDARTLAQLRSDVATDLLMRGWVPGDPTFTQLGAPPPATVKVVVSLPTLFDRQAAQDTLAGLAQPAEPCRQCGADPGRGAGTPSPAPDIGAGVGEITGWGPITAAQARALALAAGSVWARIVTDPLTGRAVEHSVGTYRPPKDMHDQVTTRDGTCRAPGCEIPADGCDLDHNTPWTPQGLGGGATSETNLSAKHRAHHNLKTTGWWHTTQDPDGVIEWTTATGRTYRTYPYIYEHPDNTPVQVSLLETVLGQRLAVVLNPPPATRAELDLLGALEWERALAPVTPDEPAVAPKAETTTATDGSDTDNDPGPPPF